MSDLQPQTPDAREFDAAIDRYRERMAALRFTDASICLVYVAADWPPPAEATLSEGPIHDYTGRLIGFPDGHLAVALDRASDSVACRFEFQRVALTDGAGYVISITVEDDRVSVKVGGDRLGPYCPGQAALEIRGARMRTKSVGRTPQGAEPGIASDADV